MTDAGRSARIRQELGHPVIDADGHFVEFMPLMLDILADVADQSVEHDLLTTDDFRKFVFTNVAEFYAGPNPDFFSGTTVEEQVASLGIPARTQDRQM